MALLIIILVIIFTGVLLWTINTFIPMNFKIKKIMNIVVMVVVFIWILKVAGLFSYIMTIQV